MCFSVHRCLCDFSATHAWGYILPVGVLAFSTAIASEASIAEKYRQLHDSDENQVIRARQVAQTHIYSTCLL
jgi:hypothetical protein